MKCFKRKNQARKLKFVYTSGTPRRRHTTSSSKLDLFWLSYSLRSASETSKTDFPATQGCKSWQGSSTTLNMYAPGDVGPKTAVTVTVIKTTIR